MRKLKVTKVRARKALREIASIMNACCRFSGEKNAVAFREIVTFLRGPDNEAAHIKDQTTAKVRHRVGLSGSAGLTTESQGILDSEVSLPNWQWHHRDHYHRAFKGLKQLGLLREGDE